MADRPIIFSGGMVKALLAGTKTQTRRLAKVKLHEGVNPHFSQLRAHRDGAGWRIHGSEEASDRFTVPYAVGDRLDPALLIEGYPDYCAGISGRVYSRKRGAWEQLQASETSKGYPAVTLCSHGQRKTTHTHAVTCEAFHGPRPSRSHQVRHLNGDIEDGCAANLCWGTQIENWQDRKAHGNGCEGEKHHCAKFSNEERDHIRWGLNRGLYSQRHAARTLGVAQSTIYEILNSKSTEPVEQIAPDFSGMRLTLTVTGVRVQRLQDISEEDAIAEGLRPDSCGGQRMWDPGPPHGHFGHPQVAYRMIWEDIHGPGSWAANPWVAAISFRSTPANIDSLPEQP